MSIIVGEEDEREIIERGTIGMSTVDKTQDKGTKKHFCESLWKWVKCPITFLNDKLEKMLGWDKPSDKPGEDVPLDLQWEQWEEAWCSALNWDRKELLNFPDLEREDDQKKKREQELKDILNSILSVQTDEWTTNTRNRQVALFLLYSVFRTSYSTALKKKKKNYWLNFTCKRRFIYLIFYTIIGHVLLAALFFCLHFIGITVNSAP